jgi:hypothetical protein
VPRKVGQTARVARAGPGEPAGIDLPRAASGLIGWSTSASIRFRNSRQRLDLGIPVRGRAGGDETGQQPVHPDRRRDPVGDRHDRLDRARQRRTCRHRPAIGPRPAQRDPRKTSRADRRALRPGGVHAGRRGGVWDDVGGIAKGGWGSGIIVGDLDLVEKLHLVIEDVYAMPPSGSLFYDTGWKRKALLALVVSARSRSAWPCWAPMGHPECWRLGLTDRSCFGQAPSYVCHRPDQRGRFRSGGVSRADAGSFKAFTFRTILSQLALPLLLDGRDKFSAEFIKCCS